MRFRVHGAETDPREEEHLVREIRGLAADDPPAAAPPDAYWPNMLVRVNRRIDDASSGRAMSLSWAARVAIPGVVAVLSFLIGLQYYVPKQTVSTSMAELLARGGVDSLLVQPAEERAAGTEELLADAYLELTQDQLSEYLVESGTPAAVMEVLQEAQVREVLSTLGGPSR